MAQKYDPNGGSSKQTGTQLTANAELTRGTQKARNNNTDDDCPWLIKLLVPPCWFANANRGGVTGMAQKHGADDAHSKPTRVQRTSSVEKTGETPKAQKKDADDGCHWLIKLLVPPCWFAEKDH